MSNFVGLKARVIAATSFYPYRVDEDTGWYPENDGNSINGECLIEFAGRACYQSWDKPNIKTATTPGYINHLLDVGHFSVLEHSSVSFYIEGISRSLSHELVRHRHFAYSQLSQRYVDSSDTKFVMPPEAVGNSILEGRAKRVADMALEEYTFWADNIDRKLVKESPRLPSLERRKRARQTARAVLPNNTETKLVMTGNYRAWRHFIGMRATPGADTEIRALAIAILKELKVVAPSVFGDYMIVRHGDSFIAVTEKASEV